MNEVTLSILEAAITVVSRYGIRKTTMSDIADTAGVSRQTLYAHYKNKDAVFVDTMRYVADKTQATVKERWKTAEKTSEKLDIYFEECVVTFFMAMAQTPDAQDLLLGFTPAGKAAGREADALKARLLASILAPYQAQIENSGTGVEQFSAFIVSSGSSAKFSVDTLEDLKAHLGALKASILSVTGAN